MTTFTIHLTLCLIFRRLCPYNTFITSWTRMSNETVSKDTEILLPSLGVIKHIQYMINLWYYGHWTGKGKYIPYISVTHKVLRSCRSKMVTSAHEVYDVQKTSSLYKETCRYSYFIYMYIYFPIYIWENPPHQTPLSNQIFISLFTFHLQSILPPTK